MFWKFLFELEGFSYSTTVGLSLAKQLMSPQKMFVINKVHYFDFLVSCLHTFNPLSLSLKRVMTLGSNATTYRKMERGKSCKITNMTSIKWSERRPFIFVFRLNIVLRDSYQADCHGNWGMEKKKFQATMLKALLELY